MSSRHGKPAADSARLNAIIPKGMIARMGEVMDFTHSESISDLTRLLLEYGLAKVEAMMKRRAKK